MFGKSREDTILGIIRDAEWLIQRVDRTFAFPFLNLDLIPELIQQSLIDRETLVLRAFTKYIRDSQGNP